MDGLEDKEEVEEEEEEEGEVEVEKEGRNGEKEEEEEEEEEEGQDEEIGVDMVTSKTEWSKAARADLLSEKYSWAWSDGVV